MSLNETPWKKRREIPDSQVRDVAEQFDDAWRLLHSQPLESGLLLPILNNAAVALELYMKCLCAVVVHTPVDDFPGLAIVTAKASVKNHELVGLLDSIPEYVRKPLEDSYALTHPEESLRDMLSRYEGLFAISRYAFEMNDKNVSQYPLMPLMNLCTFLREFTENMKPIVKIEW